MSERRINLPTKETSLIQNQSNNYYRSHTLLDVNRTSVQKSFQKHRAAKKFSFVQNNQESFQIVSKKNLDIDHSKKQLCQELTFDNGQVSNMNIDALHQEGKSVCLLKQMTQVLISEAIEIL
ncbi:hypothetical protein TTHERM_00808070 (macronuclear) [Tetrahymena thermophila SB210]|uniref:Uncharacterized protein n=1 Tax=Tetrahymena thermophila (strain SB210) TaxID=312017 RepID=Q233R6_TETTS|nr:hypothetical protein TTHERM_00808070 [Tetrahymena thermophila SB210]EAR91763.1 hypothetical protein TTHERM_00808070 [Tetrahymena thermophila SB210]|eukprot:XP_001012008.1 hypothetical protein TTHERM_00808070 [Tetrahymena thermophila SB210]